MAGDGNIDRPFPSLLLLGVLDFICLLEAADSVRAHEWKSAAVWAAIGVTLSLVGYHWPRIRQWGRNLFKSPRIAGNRPLAIGPMPSAVKPAPPTPTDVADVLIEYEHDDRNRAVPSRDRPLLLKNVTAGKNALNVQVQPVEDHGEKLVFRPDIITCVVGGGSAEVVPEYEQLARLKHTLSRFRLNHLPEFLNGFCEDEGVNEVFQEKSLWLEVHYESEGKSVISECELLFARWHEQIRTGQHRIRLADQQHAANSGTPSNKEIKIPMAEVREHIASSQKSLLQRMAAEEEREAVRSSDWQQLADRFDKLPNDIRADWNRCGRPPIESWRITGGHGAKDCESLCTLAGAMLLKSRTVRFKMDESISAEQNTMHRWLYYLKCTNGLDRSQSGMETLADGTRCGVHFGSINELARVSARACIGCAAMEM